MTAPHPQPGQTEPRTATLEGVLPSEASLRDTAIGGVALGRGGAMKFLYASGSRPLDGYTIKRGVGRGGFGEVYYATSDAGKEVALKVVRRNLEIELRGVTQCLNLKHPNLVSLYDIRQDDQENHWVVMEFVAGEGLDHLLERHPQGLPLDQLLTCIRQVGAGVAYLHDRGIVHRDLKPGNIFLDEGVFKIGDYGLSKFISASRRSGQTESIGTVHYMAPEIANGRYGKEIDIYALGVIFYEMLTGHVPYDGESLGEVLMKHLTAEPDLSGIAEPYRTVVAKLLCKDPEARYQSVQAMLADLEAGLAGQPLAAPVVAATATCSAAESPTPTSWPAAALAQAGLKGPNTSGRKTRSGEQAQAGDRSGERPRRLMRSDSDQVLSGVCAGFARFCGIDPLWMRLGFIAILVLTSFVPMIVIYILLAVLMPSDGEEIPTAAGEGMTDSRWGLTMTTEELMNLGGGMLRLLLGIIFGVGVGLLTGGIGIEVLGSRHDAPYVLGPAAGLFTAGFFGWLMLRQYRHPVPRMLLALLFSAGCGTLAAACALMVGCDEEMAALLGPGVGFLVAGLLMPLAFLSFPRSLWWRPGPPVFLGVGAGLLVALNCMLVVNQYSDAPALLGVGAGLMTCGATAWLLFFGPLAVTKIPLRHERKEMGATQVWESTAVEAGDEAAKSRLPMATKILFLLAFVLAAVPIVLYVVASGDAGPRFGGVNTYPASRTHKCNEFGCGQWATVLFSEQSFGGSFNSKHLCDAHASKAAWEAQRLNRNFAMFDAATGAKRDAAVDAAADASHSPIDVKQH